MNCKHCKQLIRTIEPWEISHWPEKEKKTCKGYKHLTGYWHCQITAPDSNAAEFIETTAEPLLN